MFKLTSSTESFKKKFAAISKVCYFLYENEKCVVSKANYMYSVKAASMIPLNS